MAWHGMAYVASKWEVLSHSLVLVPYLFNTGAADDYC